MGVVMVVGGLLLRDQPLEVILRFYAVDLRTFRAQGLGPECCK